jgi:uncharacterized MAPEG superfamily protein
MILAFWLVLAAAILPLVAIAPAKMRRDYDNADPRKQYETLSGLPRRAVAAHQNSLEAFPFFAAGVVIAYLAATPAMVINVIAFAFVLMRLLYVAAYWTDRSTLRSIVWALGWFACVALFIAPVVS